MTNNFLFNFLPVGAFTSKFYSFSSRPWELDRKGSIDFFDFFSYPVTVYTKQSEVFRVSSFNTENWISDSTRFFVDFLKRYRNSSGHIVIQFNEFLYKVSLLELSNMVSSVIIADFNFSSSVRLKNFAGFFPTKSIYDKKIIVKNDQRLSFNFFSVGKFIDLKDLFVLNSACLRIPNSHLFFSNTNFFSNNTISASCLSYPAATLDSAVAGKQSIFVFDSNLRYDAPILNLKVKRLFVRFPETNVYIFGQNSSWFSNYSTVYCGSNKAMQKLFSGRFHELSSIWSSSNSVSFFGLEFLKRFNPFEMIALKSLLFSTAFKFVFIKSDFAGNSDSVVSGLTQPSSKFFYFPGSFRQAIGFNFFSFNSNYKFKFSNIGLDFFSADLEKFFVPKTFRFGSVINSSFFDSLSRRGWSCSIPMFTFLFTANSYLSLSKKVFKIAAVANSPFTGYIRPGFSIFRFVFQINFVKYNRYRSIYHVFVAKERLQNSFSSTMSSFVFKVFANCSIFCLTRNCRDLVMSSTALFSYSEFFKFTLFSSGFKVYSLYYIPSFGFKRKSSLFLVVTYFLLPGNY